jgi:hypothetical protein
VTDVAVVSNDLSVIAHMFAIVTAKTTREIEVPNVIRVRLPIYLHLGKDVGLKDSLQLCGCALNRIAPLRVQVRIVVAIEVIDMAGDCF